MSNSIWKTPDQKPKGYKTVIEHWLNCYNEHCYDMWKQRPDGGSFDSHTIEWCYLDDLIAQADKAERLQKAVDLALDAFGVMQKTMLETGNYIQSSWIENTTFAIKQLIKGE